MAAQFVQLAAANASLVFSAGSEPSAQTSAKATEYDAVSSVVFTATAWLSPSPGASGSSKGKIHVSSPAVDDVVVGRPGRGVARRT